MGASRGEFRVISPFKAPLGISVKVEIFDPPPTGPPYYLSRGGEKSRFLPSSYIAPRGREGE